jgi:nucleoside-diphosphate-sugar epimerase
MRILVTGAAGFIGTHLALALRRRGHDVLGVDCFSDYYPVCIKELNASHLASAGMVLQRRDLAEDDLAAVTHDVEVVFHLAAQPGLSAHSFMTYERNNILATYRLANALVGIPSLRAFINISTSSVYGADATGAETVEARPVSPYGVTKLAAEQLVLALQRSAGFPACSFRLFSVYGPRERPDKLYPRLIRSILDGTAFPLFAGSRQHLRSFTYVEDIVAGLVAALDHLDECTGEIINLGLDSAITTGEGIRIVEEIMGRRARIATQPPRPGDQSMTTANIAKAERILGYCPTTDPHEGLARTVQWFTEHHDVYRPTEDAARVQLPIHTSRVP